MNKSACSSGSRKGPLIDLEAVVPTVDLREQLREMNEMSPSLEILKAQTELKAKAREEKALKQLAKGCFECNEIVSTMQEHWKPVYST